MSATLEIHKNLMKKFINQLKFFTKFCLLAHAPFVAGAEQTMKILIFDSINSYPAVVSANNQMRAAGLEVDSSKWNFYPTPSLGVEKADRRTTGSLNQDSKFMRLQQPVWTAGRLTAQYEKAQSLYEFYQYSFEEQKILAAFRWLQYYAEYHSAQLKIRAYTESEVKHLDYVKQIERRAREGYAAPSDIELSLSRLSSIQSELSQFQSTKVQASNKLEQMLRKSLTTEPELIANSGFPESKNEISDWMHDSHDDRIFEISNQHPAAKKMKAMIASAESDVSIVQSRNMPEVYIRTEIRKGDVTGTERVTYFGLNSNFGSGLSNISAIAAAQAKVEGARSDYSAKLLEIRDSYESDLQTFKFQYNRLGQLEKTFKSNRNYLESSERQYLSGRRSWQEIMNIAREEAQILVQIADAKAQTWLTHQRLQIFERGIDQYLFVDSASGNKK